MQQLDLLNISFFDWPFIYQAILVISVFTLVCFIVFIIKMLNKGKKDY